MTVNFVRGDDAKVSQRIDVDVIGVTAGLREVIFETDDPVTSVEIEFNVINPGGGSNDGCFLRLGDYDMSGDFQGGAYVSTYPDQSGIRVIESPTPQTKVWCQLGFSDSNPVNYGLYDVNECMFRIIQACE